MRIKENEEIRQGYKAKIISFFSCLNNKKTRKSLKVLAFIAFFFLGIFFSLLLTGFFGTIDKPSGKIVKFVQSFGVEGYDLKNLAKNILAENIKIPVNYLKGIFS